MFVSIYHLFVYQFVQPGFSRFAGKLTIGNGGNGRQMQNKTKQNRCKEASVILGLMTMGFSSVCHPATRLTVVYVLTTLSAGSSFQSLVNDQSGGAPGPTRQEKGEECIRLPLWIVVACTPNS